MVGMRAGDSEWTPPIVLTVATTGEGAPELVDEIVRHHGHLVSSGDLKRRRVGRARREIEALALASVQRRFGELAAGVQDLAVQVEAGSLDPFAAANRLIGSSGGVE